MTENEQPTFQQTNSFKLVKTTKGYNWEIKIYDDELPTMKLKILSLDQWANEMFNPIDNEELSK